MLRHKRGLDNLPAGTWDDIHRYTLNLYSWNLMKHNYEDGTVVFFDCKRGSVGRGLAFYNSYIWGRPEEIKLLFKFPNEMLGVVPGHLNSNLSNNLSSQI